MGHLPFASVIRLAGLVACTLVLAMPCRAQTLLHVDLNTTPLMDHPAGPFSLDFDLLDGSGTGDANNTATLSGFTFGGGAASGAPVLFGGASGSLESGITLVDSSFYNDFRQGFTAGSLLSFDVSLTTNVDVGGTPDEFSFKILDSTGVEIPTTGFGDKLLVVDIIGPRLTIETFGGDTSRTPAGGGGPIDLTPPVVTLAGPPTVVPEPSTFGVYMVGLIPLLLGLRRRARADTAASAHSQETRAMGGWQAVR